MPRPEPFDRRTFLARGARTAAGLAVLGGAPGLLAACGGGGSSSGSSTSSNAGISTATPKTGGSVSMGLTADIDGFDPTSNRWDANGVIYGRTIYDPLAAVASDGSIKPYLAQSITPNGDYTKWTITLRPNITFHNGTALDANAVKANLDGLKASALAGPAFSNVSSVDVTDPLTVVVSMSTPWVPFPAYISGQYQSGYIAEPSTLGKTAAQHPIGTGPFVFQQWVPNDHFTATKNPHYWRPGLPYLDQITYKPIVDFQSRENTLKSGGVDILHSDTLQNYVDLTGNSSFVTVSDLHSTLEPDQSFFMINTAVPPVSDVRVRQALAFATDRQKYINTIDNGVPPQSTGPFVSGSPNFAPTGYPNYDLNQAKALVAQYGQPINIQLGVTNNPINLQAAQLMQSMWKQAGIQSTISQTEQSQYILNALTGKYQVYQWTQFAASDPDINYVWWTQNNAAPVGSLALNFARNKDSQIQQALDAARASADPSVRATNYQTVAKRFASDVPYLWIDRSVWVVSAKPNVMNFNGPTFPDGTKGVGLQGGRIWPTQIWVS
ncbi:MAG TPA: ABC transporter substrate-binding protein [Acidimicrobiales bacterium]